MRWKFESLVEKFPEVAKQWHPTKNGKLTPNDVSYGVEKKAWWKCDKGPDHEWEAFIHKRTKRGHGCPFCANKKLSVTNCLSVVNPKMASEWHPSKNGTLSPRDVVGYGTRRFWWRCKTDILHEWDATIMSRSRSESGCPHCNRVSKGEEFIIKLLRSKGIDYEKEYKSKECRSRNGYLLRFDFAVWKNGKLGIIEYQGQHHYRPTFYSSVYKAEKKFHNMRNNDNIKRDFCRMKGIPLLEIPYWKYKDIPMIVEKFVMGLKKQ